VNTAFEQLLIVNSLRGWHSTGIATTNFQEECVILKDVGDPFFLLTSPDYSQFKQRSLKFLMGHGRYATVGKVTEENAHPFLCNNIVGMHNGTLFGVKDKNTFGTDSEWLINEISEKGIKKVWKTLHGAAAIIWYDFETETLQFIRNSERTLAYGRRKDGNGVFVASEGWMIREIAKRNEISLETIEVLKPNIHFTLSRVNFGKIDINYQKLQQVEIKKIHQQRNQNYPNSYSGNYQNRFSYIDYETSNKKETKTSEEVDKTLQAFDDGLTISGLMYTDEQFDTIFSECAWCTGSLKGERLLATILTEDVAVCADCTSTVRDHGIQYFYKNI